MPKAWDKNSKNDIKISSQGRIRPVKDDEKFSALGRSFERSKLFFNLIGEKMIINFNCSSWRLMNFSDRFAESTGWFRAFKIWVAVVDSKQIESIFTLASWEARHYQRQMKNISVLVKYTINDCIWNEVRQQELQRCLFCLILLETCFKIRVVPVMLLISWWERYNVYFWLRNRDPNDINWI